MTFAALPRALHAVARVLLVLGVTAALAACAVTGDVKEPRVTLENIRPAGGGLFSQRVEIDLRITNPNDFALPLDGIAADLNVNGLPLAQGVSNVRKTIPRLSSETVTLTANVSTFDLARQLFNVRVEDTDFRYDLEGTAYLGGGLSRSEVGFSQTGGFQLSPDAQGPGNELQAR